MDFDTSATAFCTASSKLVSEEAITSITFTIDIDSNFNIKNLNINNMTEGLCIAYAEALELCGRAVDSEKKYYEALEINPNSATAFKKYFDIVKKGFMGVYLIIQLSA